MYYFYPDFRQVNPYYPYGQVSPEMAQPMQQPAMGQPTGFQPTPPGGFPGIGAEPGAPGAEESYIENIIRFNRGKVGKFYMTYENNPQWNARIFRGRIETAGRDHIIISDPETGKRYLLLMVNLDFVEFDEPLAYIPPSVPPFIQQELTTGTMPREKK